MYWISLCFYSSSSLFLLSNILGHFRDKLILSLSSGQSCPFNRDTGPSQSSDIALDMAEPAGHGKTVRLLSNNSGLCTKKHGSAMRNLSLWIGSCVHYIRGWFSVGIPSTKALTVWKTPGRVVAAEHSWTDWKGNAARFVQHRSAPQNVSLWFGIKKGKNVPISTAVLGAMILLSLLWLCFTYSGGEKKTGKLHLTVAHLWSQLQQQWHRCKQPLM